MTDEEERRAFASPPAEGRFDGMELAYLEPSNPDERSLLIRAEHPELHAAFEEELDEIELDGQIIDPRLHITMHEIIANQLWDNEPPEVWRTAKRLRGLGYGRHEILHMLASVVSSQAWRELHDRQPSDREQVVEALAALPESWEAMRPGGSPPTRPSGERARRRPRPRGKKRRR